MHIRSKASNLYLTRPSSWNSGYHFHGRRIIVPPKISTLTDGPTHCELMRVKHREGLCGSDLVCLRFTDTLQRLSAFNLAHLACQHLSLCVISLFIATAVFPVSSPSSPYHDSNSSSPFPQVIVPRTAERTSAPQSAIDRPSPARLEQAISISSAFPSTSGRQERPS